MKYKLGEYVGFNFPCMAGVIIKIDKRYSLKITHSSGCCYPVGYIMKSELSYLGTLTHSVDPLGLHRYGDVKCMRY